MSWNSNTAYLPWLVQKDRSVVRCGTMNFIYQVSHIVVTGYRESCIFDTSKAFGSTKTIDLTWSFFFAFTSGRIHFAIWLEYMERMKEFKYNTTQRLLPKPSQVIASSLAKTKNCSQTSKNTCNRN